MSDLFLNKQKKRTFTCLMKQLVHKPKYLKNQQSLLGSIFQVMVNEKLIISIVKILDKDQKCKSIPIQFKVNERDIPIEIDAYKLQRKNLVNISIGSSDLIPALVVAIGEDSNDLMKCYHKFCEFSKSTKMPPVESKSIRCLNLDGIRIKPSGAKFLASIPIEKFNSFIKLVDELKKKQKAKYNLRSKTPPPNQDIVMKNEKRASRIVDISSEEDIPKSSTSRIKIKTSQKKSNVKPNELFSTQKNSSYDSSLDKNAKIMAKIQTLANIVEPMESSRIKQFCEQSIRIFYSMTKNLNKDSCIKEDGSIRIIPEIDETVVLDNITVIEGVLPVYTTKYRKAIYQKSLKVGDIEPTIILANFVRYAFPSHWIRNVTIRGSGGRKSLISLWNYKNPLKTEVDGQAIPGLGEKRFRSLLDHIVRKCGKKSYDKGTEKQLIACFAKAMHYSRTRMSGYPGKSSKNDEESSATDSEIDSTYSEADDDASDYSIEEFSEKILCTPDLKDYDYGSQGTDSDVNSVFESSTIRFDSDVNESDGADNHSKSRQSKTMPRIKKNSFKCPEKRPHNSIENNLNEKTNDFKNANISKKMIDSSIAKEKIIPDQINYYSQPAQSTSSSKRVSNDSIHTFNMKKSKKYEESSLRKKEVINQAESNIQTYEILSQDESRVYAKIHKENNDIHDENNENDVDDDVFNDKTGSADDQGGDESPKNLI